ncbi:MAG: FAD-dependent oxidoreductase, partial [Fimbriimonadaceae bacterium]
MTESRSRFLVIGSGLAGLTFALEASKHGNVIILTKAQVTDANTSYAQGGIAAAVGEADSWKMHEQDTLVAGDGLCDPAAVRFLVTQAPDAIEWLASLGARFDLADDGDFSLGREGGHSRNRIVHHLDKTGWEVERAVVSEVRRNPRIQVVEHA